MHTPVLTEKVLEYLNVKENENFIDCTIGGGGHAFKILEKNGPRGKVLGIDWDKRMLDELQPHARLPLVNDNFARIKEIAEKEKFKPVHGILLDLGISLDHFETSGRGFSFQKNEILDMRLNEQQALDAKKILNFWSKFDIEKILKEYGEEQFARDIAKAIVQERSKTPIIKTFQLVHIITGATPKWYQRKKVHPATKTFQALRIAVNNELDNLTKALPQAVGLLNKGGRLVVISFHSLEDRIVKNFFRKEPLFKILTKKPVVAAFQEVQQNPRSRSAKLRAVEKI